MKTILALNLKTYIESTGKPAVQLSRTAAARANRSLELIILPQAVDLRTCARTGATVFAQHGETGEPGRNTGHLLFHAIADSGARGVMLNHAEHKLDWKTLDKSIREAKQHRLQTMVCSDNLTEVKKLLPLKPNYIAFEIPELIGTGRSITDQKPKSVEHFSALLRQTPTIPLCGAGVSNAEDIRHAIALGTRGALLASAIAHAKKPARALAQLQQEMDARVRP